MKLILGSILVISQLILGFFVIKSYKEEHKLAVTVRRILQLGFVIVLFHLVALLTGSEKAALFANSICFISMDWLLYYLFRFSLEYIGNVFENHVNKPAMLLLLTADSVFMAANNLFEHLFSMKPVILYGSRFFEPVVKPLLWVHYGIAFMLVGFCLISLFYRAFTAPFFYRKKYLAIAVILVVLLGLNIATMRAAIDISVLGFVVEGICIYYCAFVYTPQRLLHKTLFIVAQDMDVALFVLDIEGKKLYSNTCADKLFDETKPLTDRDGVALEEWCRRQYMDYSEEFIKERSFYRDDEELILKIQLQRMIDGKKQLQGGYFVIQDRTEEINKLKRERYLATHDHLTGIYNKEYFYEQAEQYIRRHYDKELLIICTDIKDFKMINDFFSTKVGDLVLINAAKTIREEVTGAAVYGRLGNDIFALVMPKAEFEEKRFVSEMHKAFLACKDKSEIFPMVNYIGVYEVTERKIQVSVMCDRARMAIATIKGDYHKRVAYYDDALRENIIYEQELIGELDTAIAEEQFKMYLQPQTDSKGKVLGAEALIRWMHPAKGQIMPAEFIPVFEKNGLVSDVDKYIWEIACRQLKRWKEIGREDLYISVNISPRDFYFLNIYQVFVELIEKYEIDPKNLKLEITETAIVMDFKRQLELISRLRQSGFVVEMDDFGSGYSSLNMLKDIHVDVLKIDMVFLKKAEDEERSRKILKMMITLSKQLGMPVITEGVENEEQVKYLEEMGCDIFQGYYFSKPISVEEFEKKYLIR